MIDNNKLIYELGQKYKEDAHKWVLVQKELADFHNVYGLSKNALRKRAKRYEQSLGIVTSGLQSHVPQYDTCVEFKANNVLVVSDLQLPFGIEGWNTFVLKQRDKYKCDVVLSIGDILDQHALGQWVSDPDGMSGGDEIRKSISQLQSFAKEVPEMHVCLGNHDVRHMKVAMKAGLSTRYLRSMNEILDLPDTWYWHWNYIQKTGHVDVFYTHGDEKGGAYANVNIAKEQGMSAVTGHTHSNAGIHWFRNYTKQWFALNVGCLIDDDSYAFAYGKRNAYKGILGCGVVLDNGTEPRFIRYYE